MQGVTFGSEGDFDNYLKLCGRNDVVLIQFKADWCKKCSSVASDLESKMVDGVNWLAVDIDEFPSVAERFGVVKMPRFDIFARGRVVNRIEGVNVSTQNVLDSLKEALEFTPPALELCADF